MKETLCLIHRIVRRESPRAISNPLIKAKESVTTLNDDGVKSLCYEINVGHPFIVQSTSVIDEAKKVKGFFCNGENYHIKVARYFYFFFFVLKLYFCTTYILGSQTRSSSMSRLSCQGTSL